MKDHLTKARYDPKQQPVDIPDAPATSRILNYYVKNGREATEDGTGMSVNPLTSVTRKTHRGHFPPPIHDLGGNVGKLS